jgi:hypothetical protein
VPIRDHHQKVNAGNTDLTRYSSKALEQVANELEVGAKGAAGVAAAFERFTGESEPDFAATAFEDQTMIAMHARRSRRM